MFKVGDKVIYIGHDRGSNHGDGGFKKGDCYIVTDVYIAFGQPRISTRCINTGRLNGWYVGYFKKATVSKSHLPSWW